MRNQNASRFRVYLPLALNLHFAYQQDTLQRSIGSTWKYVQVLHTCITKVSSTQSFLWAYLEISDMLPLVGVPKILIVMQDLTKPLQTFKNFSSLLLNFMASTSFFYILLKLKEVKWFVPHCQQFVTLWNLVYMIALRTQHWWTWIITIFKLITIFSLLELHSLMAFDILSESRTMSLYIFKSFNLHHIHLDLISHWYIFLSLFYIEIELNFPGSSMPY